MKRFCISALALALVLGLTTAATACDKAKAATASQGGCGQKAELAAAKVGCHRTVKKTSDDVVDTAMERVMATMPKMTYKVGDFSTPCCHTAKAKAAAANEAIVYVVGDQEYKCRDTAMNKLAELMQAELPKVASVTPAVDGEMVHCPNMAKAMAAQKKTEVSYMLAGVEFDCPEKAQAVADKLAAKMKEMGCDKSAGGCAKTAAAKAEGCSKTCDKAKTAADKSEDCSKKCDKAQTASAKSGCCKKDAEAKTAADKSEDCSKKCDKAQTASAKSGCCKKDAEAKTAADKSEDCSKKCDKAQTASAKSGCCKKDSDAKTAADKSEDCSKKCDKAQTASAKSGCCKKAAEAQTAAAQPENNEVAEDEETASLTQAKAMVRRIVEFVANSQTS